MNMVWGKVTKRRVEDAESLLIFTHRPQGNNKKMEWIAPKEDTIVENIGLRKYLRKYLYHGTAYK